MKVKSRFFSASVQKSFVHLSSSAMFACMRSLRSSSSVMIHFSLRDSASDMMRDACQLVISAFVMSTDIMPPK